MLVLNQSVDLSQKSLWIVVASIFFVSESEGARWGAELTSVTGVGRTQHSGTSSPARVSHRSTAQSSEPPRSAASKTLVAGRPASHVHAPGFALPVHLAVTSSAARAQRRGRRYF